LAEAAAKAVAASAEGAGVSAAEVYAAAQKIEGDTGRYS
jgi:hypothetical protein